MINKEDPCEEHKRYLKERFDIDWVSYSDRNGGQPSGVFDFSDKDNDTDQDISAAAWRKRCVAVTNDVNIKGKDRWFNGVDLLTDSDGCENLVDSEFA